MLLSLVHKKEECLNSEASPELGTFILHAYVGSFNYKTSKLNTSKQHRNSGGSSCKFKSKTRVSSPPEQLK